MFPWNEAVDCAVEFREEKQLIEGDWLGLRISRRREGKRTSARIGVTFFHLKGRITGQLREMKLGTERKERRMKFYEGKWEKRRAVKRWEGEGERARYSVTDTGNFRAITETEWQIATRCRTKKALMINANERFCRGRFRASIKKWTTALLFDRASSRH